MRNSVETTGALMRKSPRGVVSIPAMIWFVSLTSSTIREQRPYSSCPAGVRETLRVVRVSSCRPIARSRRAICLLTAALEQFSCSAAAEKLPVLTTAAKDIMATTLLTCTLSRIGNNCAASSPLGATVRPAINRLLTYRNYSHNLSLLFPEGRSLRLRLVASTDAP